MKLKVIAACGVVATSSMASAVNVALGKPVTLYGTFGTLRPAASWSPGPLASGSSITDGVFLSEGSVWQTDTVWWDALAPGAGSNSIVIDLQGLYRVSAVALQGDNNDRYIVSYRNAADAWVPWVAAVPYGSFGMVTRQGNTPIVDAKGFRITATEGDSYYSVSEFQATGVPVPEPVTMVLGLAGLGAAWARKRRRAG